MSSRQAYEQGARFAKWRNVLQLDPAKQMPTELAIADCVHTLARYASISQSEGLVPIVEPEIVPNGNTTGLGGDGLNGMGWGLGVWERLNSQAMLTKAIMTSTTAPE